MTPFELEAFQVLVGVGGALTALWMIMRYKLRHKELEAGASKGSSQAIQAIEDLRQDLIETRAELAEVQERLDFAERVLANPADRSPRPRQIGE